MGHQAIEEGLGYAVLSEEIWPDHPEKVLALALGVFEALSRSFKATLKALHGASLWCDVSESRTGGLSGRLSELS
jgi:nitrate/nitrite transport system substrate-binding protein